MKLSAVKVGEWYETRSGVGKCVQVGGWHPPAAKFDIVGPFPRGVVFVAPRDILRKLEPHEFTPDTSQTHRAGRCVRCGYARDQHPHTEAKT